MGGFEMGKAGMKATPFGENGVAPKELKSTNAHVKFK